MDRSRIFLHRHPYPLVDLLEAHGPFRIPGSQCRTPRKEVSWPAARQSIAGQASVSINCLFQEHFHRKSHKTWGEDALHPGSCIVYAFKYRDKYFR